MIIIADLVSQNRFMFWDSNIFTWSLCDDTFVSVIPFVFQNQNNYSFDFSINMKKKMLHYRVYRLTIDGIFSVNFQKRSLEIRLY